MQTSSFESELKEMRQGVACIVEALSFLKEFVEGEYGMRFQFQAFIATKKNHEQISRNLEELRNKYKQQQLIEGHKGQGLPSEGIHAAPSTSGASYQSFYSGVANNPSLVVVDSDSSFTYQYQHQPHANPSAGTHMNPNAAPTNQQTHSNLSDNNQPSSFDVNVVSVKTDNEGSNDVDYNDDCGESEDQESESRQDLTEEPFELDPKTGKLIKRKTRRRNKVPDKNNWVREVAKQKRMRGEAYTGAILVEREDGKVHSVLAKPKRSRKLGPICDSKFCAKSSVRHCSSFPENVRQMIFKQFWRQMDWEQKKAFVAEHTVRQCIKRTSVPEGSRSRRKETYKYFLPINGEKRQVCSNMFCNTLSIRPKMLMNWIRKTIPPPPEEEPYVPKRRYMKKSERLDVKKESQKPGSKCPYCLEIIKRSDFQAHIANHMSQFDPCQSDSD